MKLPKKFMLASIPVEVVYDPTFASTHQCAGQSIYSEQKIIIDNHALPPESANQVMWHEIVHWICYVINRHDLRNDEDFVDSFAHLLAQAISTMEFGDDQ